LIKFFSNIAIFYQSTFDSADLFPINQFSFSQFIAIFDSSEAQHSTPYNIFVDDGEATSQ